MNARGKLNAAYVNGAIVLALIAGVLTNSGIVFGVILVGGVLLSLFLGNILKPTIMQATAPTTEPHTMGLVFVGNFMANPFRAGARPSGQCARTIA